MASCCKPIGESCPWDVLPPWKDITLEMCEACGCPWLKEKSSSDGHDGGLEDNTIDNPCPPVID